MRRLIQGLCLFLLLVSTSAFAVDFSGKWSGEIKLLPHHHHDSDYGTMTVSLTQEGEKVTGNGVIDWDAGVVQPDPLEFTIDAKVDTKRGILFFSEKYHGFEKWGFGVMTDDDGQEAIAGTLYQKKGHHHTESADYTVFRAE